MGEKKKGRPTVMTPEVIKTLEECFLKGATDLEACYIAKISKDALYDYIQENPAFSDRKTQLKSMTKFYSKRNIAEAVEKGDLQQSNWYLERKGKDEGFSTRQELTGADGTKLMEQLTDEQKAKLDNLL